MPVITVAPDYLTVLNRAGEILRLNRSTGALIWRYRSPQRLAVSDALELAYVTLNSGTDGTQVQQLNASGAVQLSIPNARAIGTIERDVLTVEASQIVRRNVAGNVMWALNYPTALIVSVSRDANNGLYVLNRQFGQLAKVNGMTGLSWLGVQNYTSPTIADLIGSNRSDSFLGFAPDGGILVVRNHYSLEEESSEIQIWLEHYPQPTNAPAGALTLTQTNASGNGFSDGVIRLRINNDSTQTANNIAFSVIPFDRLLRCQVSSAACDLRSTGIGSLRFDLAPHAFADFDFLSIVLPDCPVSITAQMQAGSDYVDTTVDDNRAQIWLCDRYRSGFE